MTKPSEQTTDAECMQRAGRGHWAAIRDRVRYQQWRGERIALFEGSGWIKRDFVVRGEAAAVADFREWAMERATNV